MIIEAAKSGHTQVVQLLLDYPSSILVTPEQAQIPSGMNTTGQILVASEDSTIFRPPLLPWRTYSIWRLNWIAQVTNTRQLGRHRQTPRRAASDRLWIYHRLLYQHPTKQRLPLQFLRSFLRRPRSSEINTFNNKRCSLGYRHWFAGKHHQYIFKIKTNVIPFFSFWIFYRTTAKCLAWWQFSAKSQRPRQSGQVDGESDSIPFWPGKKEAG